MVSSNHKIWLTSSKLQMRQVLLTFAKSWYVSVPSWKRLGICNEKGIFLGKVNEILVRYV